MGAKKFDNMFSDLKEVFVSCAVTEYLFGTRTPQNNYGGSYSEYRLLFDHSEEIAKYYMRTYPNSAFKDIAEQVIKEWLVLYKEQSDINAAED